MSILVKFDLKKYETILTSIYKEYFNADIVSDQNHIRKYVEKFKLYDEKMFSAYVKLSCAFFFLYSKRKVGLNWILSEEVFKEFHNVKFCKDYLSSMTNFCPYLFVKGKKGKYLLFYKLNYSKNEVLQAVYLSDIINNFKDNVIYQPATVSFLENIIFFVLDKKKTEYSPYLKKIIKAHSILKEKRSEKRDFSKTFNKLHFSKCIVNKTYINIFNTKITIIELLKTLVNTEQRIITFGKSLDKKELLMLFKKTKNYLNKYGGFLDILPIPEKKEKIITRKEAILLEKKIKIKKYPFYFFSK